MKKALIIIDIQNDYFENGAAELVGSKEASLRTKLLLEKFRNENRPVIHFSISQPDQMQLISYQQRGERKFTKT
jgi:nicotinamidase-related amidase